MDAGASGMEGRFSVELVSSRKRSRTRWSFSARCRLARKP